ncbi:hypothetical protein B296_00023254 [Ensete ventricosum]|uniref:Uncharacterized protein n=1 Tax=Ensete ventricosum TaxID=4639 RepID=A0A427AJH2_ENSVE|nr:hypothetical protein B296_00023254 [Ensete ventricosum]
MYIHVYSEMQIVILLMQAPKPEHVVETAVPKPGRKGTGKKEKVPEAKTSEIASKVLSDPLAEKLRQQRLNNCSVMRLSMTSLKAADAKEIAAVVTVIANEKLKAEKEANAGKKKQGTKKKQLHVDRADDDYAAGGYDDVDDYDFM